MSGITKIGKNPSPAAVENYLKGIHYPASKGDLVEQARENEAPDDVMQAIHQFEDKEYESTVDVTKEIGAV